MTCVPETIPGDADTRAVPQLGRVIDPTKVSIFNLLFFFSFVCRAIKMYG